MITKQAKNLQTNDIIIEGKHRLQILAIIAVNNKTITYKFKVVSLVSVGFGNIGTEYKRLTTKLEIV